MFGTESTNEVQQQEDNGLQWIRIDYPLHVTLIDKLLYRGRVIHEDLVMFGPPRPKNDFRRLFNNIPRKSERKNAERDRPCVDEEVRDESADATATGQWKQMPETAHMTINHRWNGACEPLRFASLLLWCFASSLLRFSAPLLPCFPVSLLSSRHRLIEP